MVSSYHLYILILHSSICNLKARQRGGEQMEEPGKNLYPDSKSAGRSHECYAMEKKDIIKDNTS